MAEQADASCHGTNQPNGTQLRPTAPSPTTGSASGGEPDRGASAEPGAREAAYGDVQDRESTTGNTTPPTLDGQADRLTSGGKRITGMRLAVVLGVVIVVTLGFLSGRLGYRNYETRQMQAERSKMLAVARQGALNLTTIDHSRVDADIQRILDSSTGTFRDDFQQRSEAFVQVVKQAKSKSEGTITEAGLEPQDGDQAQVLLAVSVKTTTAAAPEQDPRRWRMRITVVKVGGENKVSDVQFVP